MKKKLRIGTLKSLLDNLGVKTGILHIFDYLASAELQTLISCHISYSAVVLRGVPFMDSMETSKSFQTHMKCEHCIKIDLKIYQPLLEAVGIPLVSHYKSVTFCHNTAFS